MIWKKVWGPPFQISSSSSLGPPSNSGLQGPLFQNLNITYDLNKQAESKMQVIGKISSNK